MFVDSHCHLQLINYHELGISRDEVVARAAQNQVAHMLCVGTHLDQIPELIQIAEQYPTVSISIGLHPNETIDQEPTVEDLVTVGAHPKVVALGETGLDYYRTPEKEPWQQKRFRTQIRAARALKKPLIIHTRMAREDTIQILKEEKAYEVGGVFHCFTESLEMAKQGLELNFSISFSGILTFKNALELQEVAKNIPLGNILIETDCPYLAPMPNRGKINEPAYVKHVAECLAVLKGVSVEEVARTTTKNYHQIFS